MLAVPYFEKALYELPEDRVTPDELKALADDTERRIQGGLAGRYNDSVRHPTPLMTLALTINLTRDLSSSWWRTEGV